MSAPLSDNELIATQPGFIAFIDAYDLDYFDPLASMLRGVLIASDDPRRIITKFLMDCLCPACKGDGALEDEDSYSRCFRCHGKGAVKPARK